jgi:hypothetical protein
MFFSPKNSKKFNCEICDFYCSKQVELNRHNMTRKHKILSNSQEVGFLSEQDYTCICGKTYKHSPSLSHHKKTCKLIVDNKHVNDTTVITATAHENETITQLFLESIKQNQELQKQMFELLKDNIGGNNNTVNSHNNTTNNQFNLNFFLNETCKDAMNINDFIDYVKVKLDDFENFGEVGYPKALSDIIVRNLNELDVKIRPIHCSDVKREVLYIKDNGVWHNDETREFMKRSIMYIAHKNIKQIPTWQNKNPDSKNCHTKTFDRYNKMFRASLGPSNDEEKDDYLRKITTNIAKEVVIDKKKKY